MEGVEIRELVDDDDDVTEDEEEGEPKKCHWNYPRGELKYKSVKYVFKYVYKGHDKQVVNVDKDEEQVVNKIKRF
uniref:ATP-dependent DNA helicase PIF1-like n=1 Tax=Tanacetum cinerariifolium TaxID=118510 RepID=A0A699IYG5_TANCI|nr:ATP-dependent DNA helicase PIF1-like [Tanacetum cinerariifolium]